VSSARCCRAGCRLLELVFWDSWYSAAYNPLATATPCQFCSSRVPSAVILQSFLLTADNALSHSKTTKADTKTVTCGRIPICKTQAILAGLPEHVQNSTNESAGPAWTTFNEQAPRILQKKSRLRNTHSCFSGHTASMHTLKRHVHAFASAEALSTTNYVHAPQQSEPKAPSYFSKRFSDIPGRSLNPSALGHAFGTTKNLTSGCKLL
jgi:hypothetical protein